MIKIQIVISALLWSMPALAEDPALTELFSQQGVQGTIVMSSLNGGKTFIHNDLRAGQRFSPASTFKIPNTLIALEEKALAGKDDIFKWDGQIHDVATWNHDQTLTSAFKVSCVWCFQELARRVGAEKYQQYLRALNYGEWREPFVATTFWLDGSLQISALEQVNFLRRVYRRELPLSDHAYETLKHIMLVEQGNTYTLWAKTGWAARVTPPVGWYVGYVETPTDVWVFATNIELRDEKDLELRQKLTRSALQVKGVIH
nr:classD [uncultured bacterium]